MSEGLFKASRLWRINDFVMAIGSLRIRTIAKSTLLLVLLFLLSCNKEMGIDSSSEPISIGTASISRATEVSFEQGDKIGVWFLRGGAAFTSGTGNYKDNSSWEQTAQDWKSEQAIFYPSAAATLDYYAYYPYDAAAAATANIAAYPFAVKTDQTTHSNYTSSDFLYASAKSVTGNFIGMRFQHKLARITLNIKLGSLFVGVWPDITEIVIGGVATKTTINLATGDVSSAPTTVTEVKAKLTKTYEADGTTVNGVTAQVIVAPGQVAAGSTFISVVTTPISVVTLPLKTYKYITPVPIDLASSSSYNLNITLSELPVLP